MTLPHRLLQASLLAAALAGLAGCTAGPDYARPAAGPPDGYRAAGSPETADAAPEVPVDAAAPLAPGELARWWTLLDDEGLNALISRGIENNLDLRLAGQRVLEALAMRGVSRADLFPTVEAGASVTQNRDSTAAAGFPMDDRDRSLWQAGLEASWEIDVFGRVRRSVEAADADLQSLREDRRDVLILVISEIARSYTEARALQRRLEVVQNAVRAQGETLSLTESRFRAGLTSEVDAAQARAQLAQRQAMLPSLRTAYRASVHRLAVLLGEEPSAALAELDEPGPVPGVRAPVRTGLPSELLDRRPDIRRAERDLAAATARIGVATADLYPRFSLLGSLGVSAEDFADLFTDDAVFWSIGPSVRWNLFDAGRIRNNIRAADARAAQAMTRYEMSLLAALEDVENAITAFSQEQARRRALDAAVVANSRAVQLATDRYKSGVGDFLTVLDAQRQLYDAEDQLAESQGAVTSAVIRLYKALGGGWEDPAPQPEPAPPEPAPAT